MADNTFKVVMCPLLMHDLPLPIYLSQQKNLFFMNLNEKLNWTLYAYMLTVFELMNALSHF